MLSHPSHPSPPDRRAFSFPSWGAALAADASLSAGLKESYRQVLSSFLKFCAGRGQAPSVELAREFVELQRMERAPSPVLVQEWKDG